MFATMLIHTGGDRISPAVPEMAVIREGDQAHVWVSAGGDSLVMRRIQPGPAAERLYGSAERPSARRPGGACGSLFLDSAANSD